jgi:hypothetical protein
MNLYVIYALVDFEQIKGVISQLRNSSNQVWFDDKSRESRFSNSWTNVLKQKIESSDMVLFFLSKNSIMSEYCIWEAETAVSQKKPTAMILVDQTPLDEYISVQADKKPALNEVLSSFKSGQITAESNNDTYVSTIAAETISGEGNQVVGQQTIHNGTPVWLVGLTTAGTVAVTGYVTVKVLTQVTETYKVIFENLIKVIKTIGDVAEQHNATDAHASVTHKMSQESSDDHSIHTHHTHGHGEHSSSADDDNGGDESDDFDNENSDDNDDIDDLNDYPHHANDDFTHL